MYENNLNAVFHTQINCGYKLLCQKMPLVSKFLYTDKVKSALAKCVRHFSEHKERANERFSFDLARMFVKNAPRLTAADQSFGDFLATVTQIGEWRRHKLAATNILIVLWSPML